MLGLISDTHGLLRPEAEAALAGCERILHAGDIGDPAVIGALERIAPVVAVRGNVDTAPWARAYPETEWLSHGGSDFYLLHNLRQLDLDPAAAGIEVVVSGHTHRPLVEERDGVLYINPGSAGPRRFTLPVTVMRMAREGGRWRVERIDLLPPGRQGVSDTGGAPGAGV